MIGDYYKENWEKLLSAQTKLTFYSNRCQLSVYMNSNDKIVKHIGRFERETDENESESTE